MDSISLLQAEAGPTPPNLPKNDKCKEKYQEEYDFYPTQHAVFMRILKDKSLSHPSEQNKKEKKRLETALHCTALHWVCLYLLSTFVPNPRSPASRKEKEKRRKDRFSYRCEYKRFNPSMSFGMSFGKWWMVSN